MKDLPEDASDSISPTEISIATASHDTQVRRDLAAVSSVGMPKTGYVLKDLIADLERFLGRDNYTDAVLAGAGNLGKTLLFYENFKRYGLKIVAAFDKAPELIGTTVNNVQILDADKIKNMCERLNIHIGIIAVPAGDAQGVCDELVAGGVRAIWNFSPVTLDAPRSVIIKNEDLAASLSVLAAELADGIAEEKDGRSRL
jgi:redox-sensing transcriptional repressor